jgi:hypothetical protein
MAAKFFLKGFFGYRMMSVDQRKSAVGVLRQIYLRSPTFIRGFAYF